MGLDGNHLAYKYQLMTKHEYTYVVQIFNNYFGYYFPLMPTRHMVYWIFDFKFIMTSNNTTHLIQALGL